MATIYRVQNTENEGPYWQSCKLKARAHEIIANHSCPLSPIGLKEHPTPPIDIHNAGGPYTFWMKSDHRCGFISLEQLHAWFSDTELGALEESGFTIHTVEGEIVAHGQKQVVFKPYE